MADAVFVLGAARTDFARNLLKEGKSLRDVIVEAGSAAIAASGLSPADVQSGVVGNFAAGLFTRQLHLGAMLTAIDPALRGVPTVHVEAACASGAAAVLTGVHQILAHAADVVLVVGAEQQKTMPVADGAEVLAAAGDARLERERYGTPLFPRLFAEIARRYTARHGDIARAMATIAAKNLAHARRNPLAQTRGRPPLSVQAAMTSGEHNPEIAPPLCLADCSQVTDGAAAVVLGSEQVARRLGRPAVRLLGYGHTTDRLGLDEKDVPAFPAARAAVERAYAMASVGPQELKAAEVHDCFSITELIAYELLGLAAPGQGKRLAESGATASREVRQELGLSGPQGGDPEVLVNAGGGLIGDGHPVGATGVRQVADAYRLLTGGTVLPGPVVTFNMGGTLTTSVAMVWANA
ncbi:MAG: thiolase C-terminal domain-containing protein [Tepidisphaerales bacterium]